MHVIANDALAFCGDMSSCMLNQKRRDKSEQNIREFFDRLDNLILDQNGFEKEIKLESKYLALRDLSKLKKLYAELPQVGKANSSSQKINFIRENIGQDAFGHYPLVANYYAGSYFGIKQSLQIDAIRNAIECEWINTVDKWEKDFLLTALYGACSTIVHSVGKHFAQPMVITETDRKKITSIRLFENRNYDVFRMFKICGEKILDSLVNDSTTFKNISFNMDVCSSEFSSILKNKKISVFYADPPYTAQQYSRFYHIPEILHFYQYPQLQKFKGKFTQGIYPENKFKSLFCSKIGVKKAFQHMFNIAKDHNSHLILSYSESRKNETGNERMISLQEILDIGKSVIPKYKVKLTNFDFEYKQLNSKSNVIEEKNDKEFLIVFEK